MKNLKRALLSLPPQIFQERFQATKEAERYKAQI